MTWIVVLAVALGGALGSVARFATSLFVRQWVEGWPLGTWIINVTGSFLIGFLFAWFAARPVADPVRFGLISGVLGGFTTFSAFSLETLELARVSGAGAAFGYVAATVVVGLAACAAGLWVARGIVG